MIGVVELESLPQELKDLIVDHIAHIPDEAERKQTLRATALVSRRFRYWAHKRLFSTIILRGKYGKAPGAVTSRLRELKELIAADPFSDKTGVASHIRSFTLSLGGHRSSVAPPLEGDALPFILQKIHRMGSRPRSLSILLFMPGDNDQLDWLSFSHDFRRALMDVSRSPLLTTLRLRGFRNLPHDILAGAYVDNIKFINISIKDYSQGKEKGDQPQFLWNVYFPDPLPQDTGGSDPNDIVASSPFVSRHSPPSIPSPSAESDSSEIHSYPHYIQLESIETDHSFPILHILDLTSTRSQPASFIFQKLKSLTMNIKDESGFKKSAQIFESAPSVEKLEIKLNWTAIATEALSFQSLSHLKHLRLIHRLGTPAFNTANTGQPHTTVQDIVNLLSYSGIPRSLRRISITLSLKLPSYYCTQVTAREEEREAASNGTSSDELAQGSSNPNSEPSSLQSTGGVTSTSEPSKSGSTSPISSNFVFIRCLFTNCANVFKPLDDLLGCPSSTPDRFAEVNYFTVRLDVDLYTVPKGFTKQKEKEFAEEAAEYVKSQFFPKLNKRFEKVDEVTSERKSGGFGVVVTPRSRNS